MTQPTSDLPEFDRIVDEVIAGKRSFAFWPGTGAAVAVIMLNIIALSAWLGPTFFGLVPWLKSHVGPWPIVLPIALVTVATSVIASGIMIARGAATGRTVLRRVTLAWIGVVLLSALATTLACIQAPLWPYFASLAGLALALRLQKGLNFVMYATFQQRMRVRLQERDAAAGQLLSKRTKQS